jgi:hypothetical protein
MVTWIAEGSLPSTQLPQLTLVSTACRVQFRLNAVLGMDEDGMTFGITPARIGRTVDRSLGHLSLYCQ